ncbi:MAG: hypothetical protein JWM95_3199 [Gemmatimonadetes bacterium]|nr:hypothetical protein [Gemmatimonadota bacterium]
MSVQDPQSQPWPGDRAILFVHGIGNAQPGDYTPLVQQLQAILGAEAQSIAIYFLYYDVIDQAVADKIHANVLFTQLVNVIRQNYDGSALGNVAASFGGDVIWPVLVAEARLAIRTALVAQLLQITRDGTSSGVRTNDQRVSIIAHSMGNFHTYEALSYAAATPTSGLSPASSGFVLDNLIMMASPVQLIRYVGTALGGAVPQQSTIYSVSRPSLDIPSETTPSGIVVPCARRTVAITGNLDPVGGYLLRKQLDWAYMKLPGQTTFIDQEQLASVNGSESLTLVNILQSALQNGGPPTITPNNPHDWGQYVQRHAADLKGWLA